MDQSIYQNPEALLQALIRFHTVNPPGNERECILFLKSLLDAAGVETRLYALDDNRPNLWAEIKAKRPTKPPVLLYGHVDVVGVEGQNWTVDPFAGEIRDGYLYGRGAVDMKSGIALFVCTLLRVAYEGIDLACDLRLLVLSDEEDTGTFGSKFMVAQHPELFAHIGCALGETGGFPFHIGGKRFYPIMIAEKQVASVRLTFLGAGGHGSLKHGDTAMTKMARAVTALAKHRLRVRVTPPVVRMIDGLADGLGGAAGLALRGLGRPRLTDRLLNLLGDRGSLFDPLLHNSVNITRAAGGSSVNVIPARVSVDGDLRILPGCTLAAALDDIGHLLRRHARLHDGDYELEVLSYDQNDSHGEAPHFDALARTLTALDPGGIPVPFVLAAVTDGRILARVGVTTYGFTPMRLPAAFDLAAQAHNADERLPVGALDFGAQALMLFLTKHYPQG